MSEEIIRTALDLPARDRQELIGILQDSLRRHRHTDGNRAEQLLDTIGDILGRDIPLRSRKAEFVWARAMAVYQLTREGVNLCRIGEMMGDINHSSVIHLRNKMQDALDFPFSYMDIIHIWKQFQERIQQ